MLSVQRRRNPVDRKFSPKRASANAGQRVPRVAKAALRKAPAPAPQHGLAWESGPPSAIDGGFNPKTTTVRAWKTGPIWPWTQRRSLSGLENGPPLALDADFTPKTTIATAKHQPNPTKSASR